MTTEPQSPAAGRCSLPEDQTTVPSAGNPDPDLARQLSALTEQIAALAQEMEKVAEYVSRWDANTDAVGADSVFRWAKTLQALLQEPRS